MKSGMPPMAIIILLLLLEVILQAASLTLQDKICSRVPLPRDKDLCFKILQGDPRTRNDTDGPLPVAFAIADLALRNATDSQIYIKKLLSNASSELRDKLTVCSDAYSDVILRINWVTKAWKDDNTEQAAKVAVGAYRDLKRCEVQFEGSESPLSQKNRNAYVYINIFNAMAQVLWPYD